MYEIIPIAAGVILAVAMWQARLTQPRLRAAVTTVASLVVGFLAASVSGELATSWAFVLFDAAQVAGAVIVTLAVIARWQGSLQR